MCRVVLIAVLDRVLFTHIYKLLLYIYKTSPSGNTPTWVNIPPYTDSWYLQHSSLTQSDIQSRVANDTTTPSLPSYACWASNELRFVDSVFSPLFITRCYDLFIFFLPSISFCIYKVSRATKSYLNSIDFVIWTNIQSLNQFLCLSFFLHFY